MRPIKHATSDKSEHVRSQPRNQPDGLIVVVVMTVLAITGSTGKIGGLIAHHLDEAGIPVRLLVREESRAPRLRHTKVAVCSYGDAGASKAALAGVEVLFMASAHESADRLDEHKTFVGAAAAAGVRHIVYLSFIGASSRSGFTLARDHGATEEYIRNSGMAWTFLRDNFYGEILPHFADAEGVIRGPAGIGRFAPVSQVDVAAVAAKVLRDPQTHAHSTYDLTGPEALTLDEVAAILTRVTGKPHVFVNETIAEARASRAHYGAPDWQVDAWISTYTAIRDGELNAVSSDIGRLLGRPALGFAQTLASG
jgi:NAD(P)H dehydrogenase (quinone)